MIIISPSSISSWADCPKREMARRYRDRIPPKYRLRRLKRRIAAYSGNIAHDVVAMILQRKKETGANDVPRDLDKLITNAILNRKLDESNVLWDQKTRSLNELKLQVAQIARAYSIKILPEVEPEYIEQKFQADLGDGFMIEGTPDLVSLKKRRRALRDLKTGRESPAQMQLGKYSILLASNGIPIDDMIVDHIERVSIDSPAKPVKSEVLNKEVCEEAAWSEVNLMKRDITDFIRSNGDPSSLVSNLYSNLCNKTDCPVYGTEFCKVATNGEILSE